MAITQYLERLLRVSPISLITQVVWRLIPQGMRSRSAARYERARELAIRGCVPLREDVECVALGAAAENRSTVAPCSVVLTCRNEAESIESLLEALAGQSLVPAEVCICDGGSRDGTPERIRSWVECYRSSNGRAQFSLQLIEAGACSISEGRNRAIAAASYEFLLLTDAGCLPERDWVAALCEGFADEGRAEFVMGAYDARLLNLADRAFAFFVLPHGVEPTTFLPSARSLACTKVLWQRVDGFPEFLTFAGEDTLFDLYARQWAERVVLVRGARVRWFLPADWRGRFTTLWRYARGDGESGALWGSYLWQVEGAWLSLLEVLSAAYCFLIGFTPLAGLFLAFAACRVLYLFLRFAPWSHAQSMLGGLAQIVLLPVVSAVRISGFLNGASRRLLVEDRRRALASEGVLIWLTREAVTPRDSRLHATLARNQLVVNLYSSDGRLPAMHVHPRLEQYSIAHFSLDQWIAGAAPSFGASGPRIQFEAESGTRPPEWLLSELRLHGVEVVH